MPIDYFNLMEQKTQYYLLMAVFIMVGLFIMAGVLIIRDKIVEFVKRRRRK